MLLLGLYIMRVYVKNYSTTIDVDVDNTEDYYILSLPDCREVITDGEVLQVIKLLIELKEIT